MGTPNNGTIQNYGNVLIDTTISATDLSDGGTNTITIDNAQYQFGALGWDTLTIGGTTETGLDLGAGAASMENVDFKLTVPAGTQDASYSGTTTITAVAG